jgi:uncharacterized membrane protein YcaP (DUF421 family)
VERIFSVDWAKTFLPHTPLLEIVVRGSLSYLILFALLRVVLRREKGDTSVTDLLVVVLIADAAQNAMADNYTSLTDGMVLVVTIIWWSFFLNWLGARVPWVQRLLRPAPLVLIKDGQLLRHNMRKEALTSDEVLSQLRLDGVDDLQRVKVAYLEPDGRISVIERDADGHGHGAPPRRAT